MSRHGFLGDLLSQLMDRRSAPVRASGDRPLEELCRDLLSGQGEVSAMRMAREILARYRALDASARLAFFRRLADDFEIAPDALAAAVTAYAACRDAATLDAVVRSAEPRRQELFRRFNHPPGATADLVRMRHDLLQLMGEAPDLARVDLDFVHLFASWFNRGFLVLRQITWESPARLLEKIIGYEAVHEIGSWPELRARIDPPDRRCFAFFHPAMPDEPLIFVQVALVQGLPRSVQAILDPARPVLDPATADTATFYSISNCQAGLKGISFGNSLIKQVVEQLRQEFPHLRTFVTLSPIPGLSGWLGEEAAAGNAAAAGLLSLSADDRAFDDGAAIALRRLAARYLLEARRADGLPRDPVARFHLGNGAQVEEVHARADLSPRGHAQSRGAMVNYLYDPGTVEQNHEDFATRHRVAATRGVRALARAAPGWPPAAAPARSPGKETSPDGKSAP
jgi:malonyl-CoA decarboxylase